MGLGLSEGDETGGTFIEGYGGGESGVAREGTGQGCGARARGNDHLFHAEFLERLRRHGSPEGVGVRKFRQSGHAVLKLDYGRGTTGFNCKMPKKVGLKLKVTGEALAK